MSGAIGRSQVAVIPGTLILISDHERDRRSRSFAFKDAGKDFDSVALPARSGVAALAVSGGSDKAGYLLPSEADRRGGRPQQRQEPFRGTLPGSDSKFSSKC